jgi:hypothetical protein
MRQSPGLWITWITRCSSCTPQPVRGATSAPTGCNARGHGVQWLHPNGQRTIPGAVRRPRARACARGSRRRRASRRADRRVLRRPRGRLDTHLRAAGQAHPSRRDRAQQRMDTCRPGRVHGREHRERAQSVRGAHRPALIRRTASAARAAPGQAAVVRRVRQGHPHARLRRRRTAPVPALQADRYSQPRERCGAVGLRPYRFICATAASRSPSVRGHQSCVQAEFAPNAEYGCLLVR